MCGKSTQANQDTLNNTTDFWIIKFSDTASRCISSVSINISGDTLVAQNAVTYQWYLNGNPINGATSAIYVPQQEGSFKVIVIDSNGCQAFSNPIILTGIDNLAEEDIVNVFPNPSMNDSWLFSVDNDFIGGTAEVFDADGKVILRSTITNRQSLITLNVSHGVYLLRISSVKNTVVKKLIRL